MTARRVVTRPITAFYAVIGLWRSGGADCQVPLFE